jgi:hypothetical protein
VPPPAQTDADFTAAEIPQVKQNLERDLFDPSSAQYRNVQVVPFGPRVPLPPGVPQPRSVIYCGEINAKNRFGAYVGFRHFSAVPEPMGPDDHADIDDPSMQYHAIGWEVFCKGKAGTPVTF